MSKPITSSELLPNNINTIHANGIEIRKETISACLYNADLLNQEISEEEKVEVLTLSIYIQKNNYRFLS